MSEEKRKVINNYDEAINHINEINIFNEEVIYLRYCDLSNFEDENYGNHFDFAELLSRLKISRLNNKSFPLVHFNLNYRIDCIESIFPNTTFSHIQFNEDIQLQYCIFEGNVDFHMNNYNCNTIYFCGACLKDGITFQDQNTTTFCNFENTTIYNNIEIRGVFSPSKLLFTRTRFINVNMWYFYPTEEIDFSNSFIDENSSIKLTSKSIKKLSLNDSIIKGKLYLFSDITFLDAENCLFPGFLFTKEAEKIKDVANRYTARLLKNECIKSNDIIGSNYFRMLEMNKYQEELKQVKKETPNRFTDLCILKLNQLSNKHGQDFWRGIIFTLVIAIMFHFIYSLISCQIELYLPTNESNLALIGEYWKSMLQYLWLPDTSAFKNDGLGFWSILVYIIGKIFITYGIYQTISAFRKYSINKS